MRPQDTEGRTGAAVQVPQTQGRRRPSHPAETARRKAWAAKWAEVGREYKRQRLARER